MLFLHACFAYMINMIDSFHEEQEISFPRLSPVEDTSFYCSSPPSLQPLHPVPLPSFSSLPPSPGRRALPSEPALGASQPAAITLADSSQAAMDPQGMHQLVSIAL